MTNRNSTILLTALLLLGGCAAQEATAPEASDLGKADGWGEDSGGAVTIDESGADQIFDVEEGQYVVLQLPTNPSTGYDWEVTSTSRTFGYPESSGYVFDESGPVGSGGVTQFVWATHGILSKLGSHTVVLGYTRSWEEDAEPIETFSFTVNVVAADAQDGAVIIDDSGADQTFNVVEGQDVVVQLSTNPSTGYDWEVTSTNRTFGNPMSRDYVSDDSGPVGSGGVTRFVWSTGGVLSKLGSHTVVLGYMRSWEEGVEPVETFSFTVNVVEAEAVECAPVTCEVYCDYGFELDANGCEICSCNAEPAYYCSDVVEMVDECMADGDTLESCVNGLDADVYEVVEICCEDGTYGFCEVLWS